MSAQSDQARADVGPADNELEHFVYHISHDLRASIRALTVVPQWIEEDLRAETGGIPNSVAEHVKVLSEQALRLDNMMKDLLTYSRVGRMQSRGRIELHEALGQVTKDLDLPEGFAVSSDFQVAHLHGAERDIVTLISALVSNAAKHGAQNVHLSTEGAADGLRLIVRDDGPGIDPKFHAKIFELMTTLKPRDDVEGSGLGLAIARKIMTQHNGTIEVISAGDVQGAEFIATFPRP